MDQFHTTYRELAQNEKDMMKDIKDKANELWDLLNVGVIKDERMEEKAKEKLEEAVMWAIKGLTS